MKPILFSILFILIPKVAISQNSINNIINFSDNDKLIYLDSTYQETKSHDFIYFRIIKDYKLEKDSYDILEYYKSGVMKMEGKSKTKDGFSKEGAFIYYYDNGNKKAVTNYVKSRPNGKNLEWYENGDKKSDRDFYEDKKNIKINAKNKSILG